MSDLTYTTKRPEPQVDGGRPLRRRRSLPGGRAVVGGFLIALAAVGVFAAYTDAATDHGQHYVVARADLPLGHRITRSDVGHEAMELPLELRGRAMRDPARLVGAVVIGPVAKGELIQVSDVTGLDGAGPEGAGFGPQISFPVESARALSGQLRVGEVVDVLATYDTGAQGRTTLVVRNARVMNRSKLGGSLSDGVDGKEVLTLSVASSAETVALADAAAAGTITIVRAGGWQTTAPSGS